MVVDIRYASPNAQETGSLPSAREADQVGKPSNTAPLNVSTAVQSLTTQGQKY